MMKVKTCSCSRDLTDVVFCTHGWCNNEDEEDDDISDRCSVCLLHPLPLSPSRSPTYLLPTYRLILPSWCGEVSLSGLWVSPCAAIFGILAEINGVTLPNGPMSSPWFSPQLHSTTGSLLLSGGYNKLGAQSYHR